MTAAAIVDLSALAPLTELVEQERQDRLSAGTEETSPDSSAPEMSDEKIRAGTGRGWDEWVALAADGPGRGASHSEIATWAGSSTASPGGGPTASPSASDGSPGSGSPARWPTAPSP